MKANKSRKPKQNLVIEQELERVRVLKDAKEKEQERLRTLNANALGKND